MSNSFPRKLLVTGISRFLGNCIAELDQKDWSITGVYNSHPIQHPNINTVKVNLCENEAIENLFYKIQPDALIHLAALSDANFCEQHPEISEQVNVDTSVRLAQLCQKHSIPMVFSSTDLVFAGTDAPYSESSETKPLSIYGKHKQQAEQKLLNVYPDVCIARLPVMFGLPQWGNSFMSSWINNLKENKRTFAFTDEYRTKVSGKTAVKGLFLLLNKKVNGIWHLGGRERISRYDFAVLMAEVFGLRTELIQASRQADVQMAAARPSDVSLDSSRAFELGYDPPTIREELKRLKRYEG